MKYQLKHLTLFVILTILFSVCTFSIGAAQILSGDVDGNAVVSSSDAIYLLRHTLTPEKYPLNQNGDVNGDGQINSDDAIYLLRYTLSPDKYPILSTSDETIESLVKIPAREDFSFRMTLNNQSGGELSPITEDYYISAYKVTNKQYKVFIDETKHKAPSYWKNNTYPQEKADHPVLNISYSDAVAYCDWLSTKYNSWSFRLPTEAEWENAAMGEFYGNLNAKYPDGSSGPSYNAQSGRLSTSFQYNGVISAKLFEEYGSSHIVNYIKGDFAGSSETLGECISISANGGVSNWANHGGNAQKGYFLQTDLYALISADGGYTSSVGSYPANSYGLYDMAGNCWDITSSIIVAENGLEKGEGCYAVRGGSWYATARSCTFYYRGEGRKDSPSSTVGFRIAAEKVG